MDPSQQKPAEGSWYPIPAGQYPTVYPTGPYSLRLSHAASASVVPVVYPANVKQGNVVAHTTTRVDEATGAFVSPAGTLSSSAATNIRGTDDTIVEVPPDQMKELLEIREIKQRRLARKAELARLSRRRTRDMLQSVQGEIAKLELELRQVRSQSLRPCVRCDRRLTLCEIGETGAAASSPTDVDAKTSFEVAKLKLPKYVDSLHTKVALESSLEKARVFVHKSMTSLDNFSQEHRNGEASSSSLSVSSSLKRASLKEKDAVANRTESGHKGVGAWPAEQQQGFEAGAAEPQSRSRATTTTTTTTTATAESSEELEKFLVENLVTQYKRRHLAAKFHLAALEQHMRSSFPVNTLMCFLYDVNRFESGNFDSGLELLSELKLTPEQIHLTSTIHAVGRQLAYYSHVSRCHKVLRSNLLVRGEGSASTGLKSAEKLMEFTQTSLNSASAAGSTAFIRFETMTKKYHDEVWQMCAKEILGLLTPHQTALFFRWAMNHRSDADKMVERSMKEFKSQ